MITVNVKNLLAAIEEADVFKLPDMSAGEDYLYNRLYRKLASDEDVRLSQIDYGRFTLDDIDSLRDTHSDVLEPNEYKAHTLSCNLRDIPPTVTAAAFV